MGELMNCPRCGTLFVSGVRSICQDCYKEEERAYTTVYDFLRPRKNRQATVPEIVEATGVDEEIIFKFVKERRLRASQFPNLTFPCERCGTKISDGKLCNNCMNEMKSDLDEQKKLDEISDRNRQNVPEVNTYYTVEKKQ